MYEKYGQFIDGKWHKSSSGETYEVINPANEEIIGKASKASPEDVNKALLSAQKCLEENFSMAKIIHLKTYCRQNAGETRCISKVDDA